MMDTIKDLVRRSENGGLSRQIQDIAKSDDDVEVANLWRKKAEIKGNELAIIMKYYHGWEVETDMILASCMLKKYIEDAKNQTKEEFYVAHHMASYLYGEGIGVEKDVMKAFELCKKAAEGGCIAAINNLAISYQYGDGCEENIKMSINLYEKAHRMGHNASSFNLGLMYHHGRSVKIDKEKAIFYFEEAAMRGFTKAINYLVTLYKEKKNLAKEKEYLIKGALLKNTTSITSLIKFISENNTEWEPILHCFWLQAIQIRNEEKKEKNTSETSELNQILSLLLLISKFRTHSSKSLVSKVFVKGISMKVVQYLSHLYL
eukprot:TRINITY_DN764_c0_g1_i2.p1 TRINITY_DN764_c0_g1~~TRINITY_DN764_c0_g1_i2.p1  ORF type:complete len:318 (+),score=109.33 TRINITY_DN764_c0_g1_i2:88-1041(+)